MEPEHKKLVVSPETNAASSTGTLTAQSPLRIPDEIRDQMYKMIVFSEEASPPATVRYYRVLEDARIVSEDKEFVVDVVDNNGSYLFGHSIVKIVECPEEILSVVLPHFIFSLIEPAHLTLFAKTFAAHTWNNARSPEFYVVLDLIHPFKQVDSFTTWQLLPEAHGYEEGVASHIEAWVEALNLLPDNADIVLYFDCIWRDYRGLNYFSKLAGLPRRNVMFQFGNGDRDLPDKDWHQEQTFAAVTDVDRAVQRDIDPEQRNLLVDHGCRGFNIRRRLFSKVA